MNPLIYNHPEQWTLLFINHPEQWTLLFNNHPEWWTSSSITTQNNKYLTLHHPEQWTPLSITTLNNKLFVFTWTMNPLIHHYPTNCLSSPEQWTPLSITTQQTVCLHLNNEAPYPPLALTTNCLHLNNEPPYPSLPDKLFVFTWTMKPLIHHHP